ncbi:hypothetical protein [Flindersiella endophytica]
MGWGAPESEPDIAEVTEPRRMPTWAKRALWIGLPVLAIALFVISRQIGEDFKVAVDPVRFDQRYEADIDLRVTNLTGELQGVIIRPPAHAGIQLHDVTGVVRRDFPNEAPIYIVEVRQETTLTIRLRPTDCAAARAGGNGTAQLKFEIGPVVGRKENVQLPIGTWRDLIPPACDDAPNRGQPKLADQRVVSAGALLVIQLEIDNEGGLPLTFTRATLDQGVPAGVLRSANAPEGRRLDIGQSSRITLTFRKGDCDVPEDGPARVALHYATPSTGKEETLTVPLADTWTNLLGACSTRR